jgi:signal peptidase I
VDGKRIAFDGGTAYDVNKIFGNRKDIRPRTSATDLGDLAPAGIGARNARLAVTRLQVWRDIYYIAAHWNHPSSPVPSDFVVVDQAILDLPKNPALWDRFGERRSFDFSMNDAQLFVMGDNSAESSDARLWVNSDRDHGMPGSAYLDKRLLIGKALCVYWPHSWNRIPGTPIPLPLFPNFGDMRLVR